MNDAIGYPWQQMVLDAFRAHGDDLSAKINLAEKAVAARLGDPNQTDPYEHIALRDAMNALKVLIAEARAYMAPVRADESAKKKDIA